SFAPGGYRGPSGDGAVRLSGGEHRSGVDIVLRSGGVRVAGRVLDATGGVVPGAIVVAEGGDEDAHAPATPVSRGVFSWFGPRGTVRRGPPASGYAPSHAAGPAPGHFFAIHLVPGATLVGRTVIAGQGTPVAGVRVEAIAVEGGGGRAVV